MFFVLIVEYKRGVSDTQDHPLSLGSTPWKCYLSLHDMIKLLQRSLQRSFFPFLLFQQECTCLFFKTGMSRAPPPPPIYVLKAISSEAEVDKPVV